MKTKHLLLTVWSLFMAGILIAACGGSGNESAGQTGAGGRIGTEEFGMTDEDLVAAIEQVEAGIASCMSQAGFQYVPIDPVSFREAMDALTQPAGLSDEEFVAQYGYGISTLPPTQSFGAGPENQATFAALSSADQVAYQRTLTGEDAEATFVFTLENEDFAGIGGCTKTAVEAVLTPEQLSPNFRNPFDVLVAQDLRVVAAQELWSDCMRESGYDFETPDNAEDEIADRLDTVTGGEGIETLSGNDAEALASLQAEERASATVNQACQIAHLLDVELQVERDISGRN